MTRGIKIIIIPALLKAACFKRAANARRPTDLELLWRLCPSRPALRPRRPERATIRKKGHPHASLDPGRVLSILAALPRGRGLARLGGDWRRLSAVGRLRRHGRARHGLAGRGTG